MSIPLQHRTPSRRPGFRMLVCASCARSSPFRDSREVALAREFRMCRQKRPNVPRHLDLRHHRDVAGLRERQDLAHVLGRVEEWSVRLGVEHAVVALRKAGASVTVPHGMVGRSPRDRRPVVSRIPRDRPSQSASCFNVLRALPRHLGGGTRPSTSRARPVPGRSGAVRTTTCRGRSAGCPGSGTPPGAEQAAGTARAPR